jgi:Spy/CpxP family protein refolding chaperone
MYTPRAATTTAVAAASLFLFALPVLALTEPTAPTARTTQPAPRDPEQQSSTARPAMRHSPQDDFVGLDFTPEQKTAIEKIHKEAISRRETILRDAKLSPEQKDAMISGYGRIEYGEIYKVLKPEQQTKVRDKIRARHDADKTAHKGMQGPPKAIVGR